MNTTLSMETIRSMSAIRPEQLEEAVQRGYVAAYRILGTHEESRDACQEAARKALAAGDRYDPERPFYPWFYRILKNGCLDRLADRKKRAAQQEDVRQALHRRTPITAEDRVIQGEQSQAVLRAITSLPTELREVLELRHCQDLKYEDIAEIVGCPIGTVMSRLYRARKQLRTTLLADPDFTESRPSTRRKP